MHMSIFDILTIFACLFGVDVDVVCFGDCVCVCFQVFVVEGILLNIVFTIMFSTTYDHACWCVFEWLILINLFVVFVAKCRPFSG